MHFIRIAVNHAVITNVYTYPSGFVLCIRGLGFVVNLHDEIAKKI